MLTCTLICGASVESVSQLFTGFALLARRGVVDVKLASPAGTGLPRNWWGVGLLTSAGDRVVYDTGDAPQLNTKGLDWCDHYFKRSFDPRPNAYDGDPRVRPLGLNYAVYTRGDWRFRRMLSTYRAVRRTSPRQAFAAAVRLSAILSAVSGDRFGRSTCQIQAFEAPPLPRKAPKVFRIARTWDPRSVVGAPEQADHWATLNRERAEVVRILRRELGDRFVGGLAPSHDANRDYPDCIVPDASMTKRRVFLRLMKECDVCVGSVGLGDCVPWSLAEYVAASRAIVSEPPRSVLTGGFDAPRNFEPFHDAASCVDGVLTLLSDETRRRQMMEANSAYYHRFLRPDMLVWHTLRAVTEAIRPPFDQASSS